MKKLLSLLLLLQLVAPAPVLAATIPVDAILGTVDAAFAQAQDAVKDSPLDDSTKNSISNVLKTRHDTVKNSIGNIK
jgi:hypothetical protein